jgi:hypothetical protein
MMIITIIQYLPMLVKGTSRNLGLLVDSVSKMNRINICHLFDKTIANR